MGQLSALALGKIHRRRFSYAVIQLRDEDSQDFGRLCSAMSSLAQKHRICHGSACFAIFSFYAGLVDPVYEDDRSLIAAFVKEAMARHSESLRAVYGSSEGLVGNVGLFGALSPAGFLNSPNKVLEALQSVTWGRALSLPDGP